MNDVARAQLKLQMLIPFQKCHAIRHKYSLLMRDTKSERFAKIIFVLKLSFYV